MAGPEEREHERQQRDDSSGRGSHRPTVDQTASAVHGNRTDRAALIRAIKEQALERTRPAHAEPGRYRASDKTIAFLEAL